MLPQLGVTELVFTLIQQTIKYDTNNTSPPQHIQHAVRYYCHTLLHYCQLLRNLRARISKLLQYMEYRSLQAMCVQDALPTNLRWV